MRTCTDYQASATVFVLPCDVWAWFTSSPPRPATSSTGSTRRFPSHCGACHCPAGGGACPIFHWSITMSLDLETTAVEAAPVQGELLDAESSPLTLSLQDFVGEFGDELLDALNSANPPVYNEIGRAHV